MFNQGCEGISYAAAKRPFPRGKKMPWRQTIDLSAFDPETVQLLSSVLDEAWSRAERDSAGPGADAQRLEMAKHIVEYAMKGERDRYKLVAYALIKSKLSD